MLRIHSQNFYNHHSLDALNLFICVFKWVSNMEEWLCPQEAPLKMSMLARFQSPKVSKIHCTCFLVFCELLVLWEIKNLFSPITQGTQGHEHVPLVVFILGCYWETGTGNDSVLLWSSLRLQTELQCEVGHRTGLEL